MLAIVNSVVFVPFIVLFWLCGGKKLGSGGPLVGPNRSYSKTYWGELFILLSLQLSIQEEFPVVKFRFGGWQSRLAAAGRKEELNALFFISEGP